MLIRRLFYITTVTTALLLVALLIFPVAFPANASSPARGRTVVVDPGHGGEDSGAVNRDLNVREKDINLAVSLRLKDKLKSAGAVPVLTRDTDKYLTLGERVNIANAAAADVFISIHTNAFTNENTGGTETYYWPDGTARGNASKLLAEYIQEEMLRALGFKNRGVKNNQKFYVIAHTSMPSILVELGFITNPDEGRLLSTPEYQDKAASAILRGLERYFQAVAPVIPPVSSIFGPDRYATAAAIAKAGWSPVDTVVIARGDDFADALAGTPLAHKKGAPILLVGRDTLPASTKEQIKNMNVNQAIVLGGTAAISNKVENDLSKMGLNVDRIAGDDRYETAEKIARNINPTSGAAAVVRGDDFPDALSAGPYAAGKNMPILLVDKDAVPDATDRAIREHGISEVVVVGGKSVISENVLQKLPGAVRFADTDRYKTAVEVAQKLPRPTALYIASGTNFADALAGGALASKEGGVILLTYPDRLPDSVQAYLRERCRQLDQDKIAVLGGPGAVSKNVCQAIASVLNTN